VHLESQRAISNATYLSSPSTCVQFARVTVGPPVMEHIPPGYRVFELHDDGRFETRVVRLPDLKFPPLSE
jgi:Icc protein